MKHTRHDVDQSSDMLQMGLMEPCMMNYNTNFLGPEIMAMAPEAGSMNFDCPAAEFPIQVPFAPMMVPVPLSPESQELVSRLENRGLINDFEQEDGTGNVEMMLPPHDCGEDDLAAPDSFFDDFPTDMFDHIESL